MTKLISICFACYGNIFSEERMMIDMSDSSLKYSSWTTVKDICLSVHVNCNNTSSMIWRSPFSSFQLTNKRFSIQIFFFFFSPQWYMSKVMDFNQHLLKIAWKWESPWHLIRRSIIKLKLWQNTEWWYWTGHTQTDNSERFFFSSSSDVIQSPEILFLWMSSKTCEQSLETISAISIFPIMSCILRFFDEEKDYADIVCLSFARFFFQARGNPNRIVQSKTRTILNPKSFIIWEWKIVRYCLTSKRDFCLSSIERILSVLSSSIIGMISKIWKHLFIHAEKFDSISLVVFDESLAEREQFE